MTDADPEMSTDQLQREAVAWVNRLTSGRATTQDAANLERWCAQSPAHAQAFAAARLLWADLDPAGRSWRRRSDSRSIMSRRVLLGTGLAAASVAGIYVVTRPPLDLWPSLNELSADYRTGVGEQRDVDLSRNFSVRMNTRTSLAFRGTDRNGEQVELISGEAAFTSRSAGGQTFSVLAADRIVTATLARFDVRRMQEQPGWSVCVTCLEGFVEVRQSSELVQVAAGQQCRYDSTGRHELSPVDVETATAWQRGVLIFRSSSLAEVVTEVNRYRQGRIIVTSAELARVPVSGRFRIDHLDEILLHLERTFGAKARTLPGGIVLLS